MPKVSIVLPTFNGKRYLRQSVESIINQIYTDWELIIVDDCSTDETSNIVDEYAMLDSRIYVIHNKENRKLPASLNIGFSIAKGHYLTWTSDDNLFEKDALKVMVDYLDIYNNIYMVCGGMNYIDEAGNIIGQVLEYSDEKMYVNNCVGACFMYRKELRDAVGNYDESTFCVEDYDYWLRVLEHFGRIMPIKKVLYKYRKHSKSLSQLRKKQVRDQLSKLRVRYCDKIFEALQKNPQELYKVYLEMRSSKYITQAMTERFMAVFPALRTEVPFSKDKIYIIFGAGKYGEKAAEKLGRQVAFFADNNPNKVGNIKDGIKILSFEEAVKLERKYHFLIAASGLKSYEMMVQLQKAGIKEYSLFEI